MSTRHELAQLGLPCTPTKNRHNKSFIRPLLNAVRQWFLCCSQHLPTSHAPYSLDIFLPLSLNVADVSDGHSDRKLAAPSLHEVLHLPLQPMTDLSLVEEGLLHPEKPEVFLSASMQFLRRKLILRLQLLQKKGLNIKCPCQMSGLSEQCLCHQNITSADSQQAVTNENCGSPVVSPPLNKVPLGLRSDSVACQMNEDWNSEHSFNDDISITQDIKCTESAPGHQQHTDSDSTMEQIQRDLEYHKNKNDSVSKNKTKVNIKISKGSRHYNRVQSAVMNLLNGRSKSQTKQNVEESHNDNWSEKSMSLPTNTEHVGVQTSIDDELNKGRPLSRKSVSLAEIESLPDGCTTKSSKHHTASSKSPRRKFSTAVLNMFNKQDRDIRLKEHEIPPAEGCDMANTDSSNQLKTEGSEGCHGYGPMHHPGDNLQTRSLSKFPDNVSQIDSKPRISTPVNYLHQSTNTTESICKLSDAYSSGRCNSEPLKIVLDPIEVRRKRFHSVIQNELPEENEGDIETEGLADTISITCIQETSSPDLPLHHSKTEKSLTCVSKTIAHTIQTTNSQETKMQEEAQYCWKDNNSMTAIYVARVEEKKEPLTTTSPALARLLEHISETHATPHQDVIELVSDHSKISSRQNAREPSREQNQQGRSSDNSHVSKQLSKLSVCESDDSTRSTYSEESESTTGLDVYTLRSISNLNIPYLQQQRQQQQEQKEKEQQQQQNSPVILKELENIDDRVRQNITQAIADFSPEIQEIFRGRNVRGSSNRR